MGKVRSTDWKEIWLQALELGRTLCRFHEELLVGWDAVNSPGVMHAAQIVALLPSLAALYANAT